MNTSAMNKGRSMIRMLLAILAVTLLGAAPLSAQTTTPDPRIRVFTFDENRIIPLRGHLGYQMLIEFDPAERIENVAIGDSLGWQVTPNRAATLLFVKPLTRGAATNMTVITSLRRYSFELTAREASGPSDPSIIYSVRFRYPPAPEAAAPPPPPPAATEPREINVAYSLRGGPHLQGLRVFDDGVSTYFQFPEGAETTAIYLVGRDRKEELVNAQARGRYTVVDVVAGEFVLRVGRTAVRVRNNAWGAGDGKVNP